MCTILGRMLSLVCALFLAVAPVFAQNKPLSRPQARTTVRLASEATYPPFVTLEPDGTMGGIETRLLQVICERQQLHCIFLNQPFDSLIPGLKMGRFDAVFGGIDATLIRAKQVDFSATLYPSKIGFLVPEDSTIDAFEAEELRNRIVAVQQGTTFIPFLRARYRDIVRIRTYPSAQEAFIELQAGRVHGILADLPVLTHWQKRYPHYRVVYLGSEDRDFFGAGYAMAFRKDAVALRQLFNQGLYAIQRDGTYEQITGSTPAILPVDRQDRQP